MADCGLVVSTQVNSPITLWDWYNVCSPLAVVDRLQNAIFFQAIQLLPNLLFKSKPYRWVLAEDELSNGFDLEAGLKVMHGTQLLCKYLLVFLQ